ncbi:serine/threonine-protein kinase [Paludisphaera borealis]|uniref:Serine/threonine-protein kinase PknL n=1 Tax=Paludisphaera borealis TaxID=1387353 RepID=A0A1U7CPH8_9BACT|nr:serine/threonine-protein kinase [Paludisphaera borealis]APW60837.1 Serine/threonine-protein kinase PknL [Paludisphaera borealis]
MSGAGFPGDRPVPSGPSAGTSCPDSFAPRRRVVSSAGVRGESEIRDVLHGRLRAAVFVLSLCFLAFFVVNAFSPGVLTGILHLQGVVVVMLMAATALLSTGWKPSSRRLRIMEAVVFGGVGVYFIIAIYLGMRLRLGVEADGAWQLADFLKSALSCMLLIIYTYAIFIPNDARRAARMIAPLALTLLVAPSALALTTPAFRALLGTHPALSFENLGEHALLLTLAASTAVYGAHTINRYRAEVLHSREMNQYVLIRKLGAGGMGDVFLAEHSLLKRPCALKLINEKLDQNPTALARFELEVRATARLSHWNTVEVYDYGRTDLGAFFYVMEYLPGCSLQELVDRHGPLPAGRVIYLLRQACGALNEAHQAGLVHRDLKPPNIFAAYRGGQYDVAKILDFGLVKPIHDERSSVLTLEGVVTGSPLYMAPELIVRNHEPDARVDVYGIGAVAYYLLTGRPPFLGPDAMAVMIAHARDPVEPLSAVVPGVPPDLEEVVLRCLEKDPADRFQDVVSLARALEACSDADDWSAERAAAWWRTHQPIEAADQPPPPPDRETDREALDSLNHVDFQAIARPGPREPLDPELTIAEDRGHPARLLPHGYDATRDRSPSESS